MTEQLSDWQETINEMADTIYYLPMTWGSIPEDHHCVGIGAGIIPRETFMAAMEQRKCHRNLYAKMLALIELYHEVDDQLDDIVQQYWNDNLKDKE